MKVKVKTSAADGNVSANGIDFEVRDKADKLRGHFFVAEAGIIWCERETDRKSRISVSWDDFISWMASG